ncbi:MAG: FAD-binding protein, partial [Sutterella sp.]|nr:FAD-binding protein [Sutterella sp.]
IYGGLIVDGCGDRFMNEQYLSDRPLALGGELSLRAARYYAVLDEDMYRCCRDEGIFSYYGRPGDWYVGRTGFAKEKLPNLDRDMAEAVSRGYAAEGTLAECAKTFGLENLEKTVARYNELCRSGSDDDFFKSGYLLKALKPGRFRVVEYEPSIWCTFGGVKTDAYCRALTPDQKPIPGLYVAGVDNGSLYCSPYYENEGAALGLAFTSGIVAGDCMVKFVRG